MPLKFKVLESPDPAICPGAILSISEAAQLLELNAEELCERSFMADQMSAQSYCFKIIHHEETDKS